jgi:hypothetical protein
MDKPEEQVEPGVVVLAQGMGDEMAHLEQLEGMVHLMELEEAVTVHLMEQVE